MESKKVRMVFDIDDTICSNIRRTGYENCVKDSEVVDKINYLHDSLGFEIILHTSRGMISCNGDKEKIIEKNRDVLVKWLEDNDVHYDEIVFCKPIADVYVDDKAMNVDEFRKAEFCNLSGGGSNKPIYGLGNVVKKTFGSPEEVECFKDWIEDNNGSCNYPKVHSYLYDSVYMDKIDGKPLCDCIDANDLISLLNTINEFSKIGRSGKFNLRRQIDILEKNKRMDPSGAIDEMILMCKRNLMKRIDVLRSESSYSHGDMILSNVIKGNDGKLYFIDTRYFRDSTSYLLDLAKLRNSLCGYERIFGISKVNKDFGKLKTILDSFLIEKGVEDVVIWLQLMYILRLYRYKDDVGKLKVTYFAKRLIKDEALS